LGARGGEPRESNPRGGFCHMFLSLGILPLWGFASLFSFRNWKKGNSENNEISQKFRKIKKKIENMNKTISRI